MAGAIATLAVLPTLAWYNIEALVVGRRYAFLGVCQRAARWTGMTGIYLRRALYRHLIAEMGEQVSVSTGTILTKPSTRIGNAVYIGSYGVLGDVHIGENTLVADHVCIVGGQHGMSLGTPIKDQPEEYRTISIGVDCWIGSGATVLADVGDHCVVGAGSVVTKPVPDYFIVAGNPARQIGDRRVPKAGD
jgi:acetyltransferase-like isoleucine patch superfamily enzyme